MSNLHTLREWCNLYLCSRGWGILSDVSTIDPMAVLDRMKTAYGLRTEAELATHLEMTTARLGNWRIRKTVDWNIIFAHCDGINFHWLLTGAGAFFPADDTSDASPFYRFALMVQGLKGLTFEEMVEVLATAKRRVRSPSSERTPKKK